MIILSSLALAAHVVQSCSECTASEQSNSVHGELFILSL